MKSIPFPHGPPAIILKLPPFSFHQLCFTSEKTLGLRTPVPEKGMERTINPPAKGIF